MVARWAGFWDLALFLELIAMNGETIQFDRLAKLVYSRGRACPPCRSTDMKTQDTNAAGQQNTPQSPSRPKPNRWLVGIGAIVVVILVVGLSALVFAQLKQRQAGQTAPTPPTGQWKQVLAGYTFTSLVAARSKPAVLYACAIREAPNAPPQSNQGVNTILRSVDFGNHWQDIGGKAALGNTCQLAVNPADSNDIYAVSNVSSSQNPGVLKHSRDGGQTWQTIQPVMHLPSLQTPVVWSVQQIRIEGNHLFGVQLIMPRPLPVGPPTRPIPNLLPRLVTSIDGGHNWIIIDNQLAAQRLGVHSYAVDPTDPGTIYDLVGFSWFPINLRFVPTYDQLPVIGLNQELYKTTDGGATWRLALANISYGSQVQLASGKPQVIYVGGTLGPLPLIPNMPQPTYPIPIGGFHLQLSTNGGSNWQNITIPSDMQSIQNWFVSPIGQAYASPTIPSSSQPTAIPGTIVPATPVPFPTGNPQSGIQRSPVGADLSRPSPIYRPSSLFDVHLQTTSIAFSQFIRRYDPNTGSWSNVAWPPSQGYMLQLTPAQATSGAILWFVGTTDKGQALYRYVV
jgi:photosystem II stability/assembly factor-like uncharacterized protein